MTELEQAFENVSKTAYHLWLIFGESFDIRDLRQEGYLAVLEAKERYDPEEDASLTTFVYRGARGAMLDYINRNLRIANTNKSSIMMKVKANMTRHKEDWIRLTNQGSIEESFEEYFECETGIDPKYLYQYEQWMLPDESMDRVVNTEVGAAGNKPMTLHDVYPSDSKTSEELFLIEEDKYVLDRAIKVFKQNCTPLEWDILEERLLVEEKTPQTEIAKIFKVSQPYVYKVEKKIIEKVRKIYEQM